MIWKIENSNTRKSKSWLWLFEKHNKMHKALANLSFNKEESTNTQKQKFKGEIA